MIFTRLLETRCTHCRRVLIHECKNRHVRAATQVCSKWHRGWHRLILVMTFAEVDWVCFNPQKCLREYLQDIPPLPFMVTQPQLRDFRNLIAPRRRGVHVVPEYASDDDSSSSNERN